MRTRFVEHLSREKHPHWQEGKLLNKQAAKPPVASLRSKAISGCKWSVSEGL
jgi:hypothetical protein